MITAFLSCMIQKWKKRLLKRALKHDGHYVDKNFVILDGPKQKYHNDIGVIYVANQKNIATAVLVWGPSKAIATTLMDSP